MIKNKELVDRFLRYVKVNTQSDEDSESCPTTQRQFDLADILSKELEELGCEVIYDRENCYVYGYLPGTGKLKSAPALGFVAHVDTSPDASGENVNPRIIENYQGNDEILRKEEFPDLLRHIGEDIIATDKTTLLGADDKAGIAEIMSMLSYYKNNPDEEHLPAAICFTPDEETGKGTLNFNKAHFKAERAYTVDGGELGIVEYECFNAAVARLNFNGKNVHPGAAKNVMINSTLIASEFISMLPGAERPEHTQDYEGFYHVYHIEGDVTNTQVKILIRDHDKDKFEQRKEYLRSIESFLNLRYGNGSVELEITDQYKNMAELLGKHRSLVDNALNILKELGVDARTEPIRGGTDGAQLTFIGIPCPNLCTGGYNYHSVYEYASVQEMETVTELLVRLLKKH